MTDQLKAIEATGTAARDRDGLHRRRGIWHATVRVNGTWREISTGTRNWQEARAKRREILAAIEAGKLPSDMAKWPVAKALAHWLDCRAHEWSPATLKRHRVLAASLARHLPAPNLWAISAETIRAYQAARLKAVSAKTVNLEVHILRGALKQARLWSRLADEFKPLAESSRAGRALQPEEEAALFRTAASRPGWHVAYCAAILAANTTARSCEIRGLRLADVDLFGRTMSVRRASTKTDAGARIVPLNDAALWAASRLLDRARGVGATEPEHYLLPRQQSRFTKGPVSCAGTGFDPAQPMRGWRTAWRKLTRAAGLSGLRFHDLRHHAITKLAEAGVPDQTLMAMAGHVSRAMLEHYSHVRMEAKRAAVAAISAGAPVPAAAAGEPTSPVQ